MSSIESESSSSPQYLKFVFLKAEKFYSSTVKYVPMLESSLSYINPYLSPVTSAFSKYADPVIQRVDTNISAIDSRITNFLKCTEKSLKEKKKLNKAGMKAWIENQNNFKEFFQSFQKHYNGNWKESIEEYALNFYNKSLNYQKPKEMLKLAADLLSEGSDNLRGSLEIAWKKAGKFQFADFVKQLKELMGENWKEKFLENAEVFLSLVKLKSKILVNKGLAEDWRARARDVAETTSLIIFAGADELYYWSKSTWQTNYAVFYKRIEIYIPYHDYLTFIVKTLSAEKMLALTWPQDLKHKVSPVLDVVGLEKIVTQHWNRLDKNQDGTVTLGDLYFTVAEISAAGIEFGKKKWNSTMKLFQFNGENQN